MRLMEINLWYIKVLSRKTMILRLLKCCRGAKWNFSRRTTEIKIDLLVINNLIVSMKTTELSMSKKQIRYSIYRFKAMLKEWNKIKIRKCKNKCMNKIFWANLIGNKWNIDWIFHKIKISMILRFWVTQKFLREKPFRTLFKNLIQSKHRKGYPMVTLESWKFNRIIIFRCSWTSKK